MAITFHEILLKFFMQVEKARGSWTPEGELAKEEPQAVDVGRKRPLMDRMSSGQALTAAKRLSGGSGSQSITIHPVIDESSEQYSDSDSEVECVS